MKIKALSLSLAALAALPGITLAQGTFLSDPNDNSNHALVVAPGGSVGIGKNSPEATLDVGGSGLQISGYKLWTTDNWFVGLKSLRSSAWLTSTNDTGKYIGIGMAGSGWYFIKSDTADGTGRAEYPMVIRENDNVGIGTVSPIRRLEVRAPSGTDIARFSTPSHFLDVSETSSGVRLSANGGGPGFESVATLGLRTAPSGADQLFIDATGYIGIGTTTPSAKLDVNGKINCTVLELTSDRNQKKDFAAVDSRHVLEQLLGLPILTWAYTNDAQVRRIGPMAQDWKVAYPELGSDNKHIGAGDLGSVALAAIQGLNEKLTESLKEKDDEIAVLKQELKAFKTEHANFATRFEKLEKMMAQSVPSAQSATSAALAADAR